MNEVGTLRELNVKPGDVVEWHGDRFTVMDGKPCDWYSGGVWASLHVPFSEENCEWISGSAEDCRIISRAAPIKYTPWQLATPDAMVTDDMQVSRGPDGEIVAYRAKVEPEVETVALYGAVRVYGPHLVADATHKITFTTIDGEPDCTSIKMEKL